MNRFASHAWAGALARVVDVQVEVTGTPANAQKLTPQHPVPSLSGKAGVEQPFAIAYGQILLLPKQRPRPIERFGIALLQVALA